MKCPLYLLLGLLCFGFCAAKLGGLQSTIFSALSRSNTLLKNTQILQNKAPTVLKSYVGQTIEKSIHAFNKKQRILADLKAVADDTLQFANNYYRMTSQGLFDDNDAVTDFLIQWMLKYPNTVQFGIYSYAVYSIYRFVFLLFIFSVFACQLPKVLYRRYDYSISHTTWIWIWI
jgi:hypothetical protein